MPITVETEDRTAILNVTDRVAAAVPDDFGAGVCTVFVPHTTAGITVNEDEPGLVDDLGEALETLVPTDGGYAHDRIDDNAAAHLRTILLGSHATVPVRDGTLALGTWQALLFVEGDGPRSRQLVVTLTPGTPDSGA